MSDGMLEPLSYQAPSRLTEALTLLSSEPMAVAYAGGVTLIPRLRSGASSAGLLVDLKRIPGLRGIRREDSRLWIGPLTTHRDLAHCGGTRGSERMLAQIARQIGSVQVRNRGTFGGNLAAADAAYDLAPLVLATAGRVTVSSLGGQRRAELNELIPRYGETTLLNGELITAIELTWPGSHGAFVKFRRSALESTIVGVAVALDINRGICVSARIALGNYSTAPIRAKDAEAELLGTALDPSDVAAATAALDALDPVGDRQASAGYRHRLTRVLLGQAIDQALGAPTSAMEATA
jgi:aerobic carbon-monoxide dehydrogenase medium subunit